MTFFSKILEKLGLEGHDKANAGQSTAAPSATTSSAPSTGTIASSNPDRTAASSQSTPKPISEVDVVAQLEQRSHSNPQKLNWRTSIVDLLKLLDLDSSFAARKELAQELGCPPELMGDSAKMNMWLHKAVLHHIAANGGNIPKELYA